MNSGKTLWRAEKDKGGNLQWKEFPPLDPDEAIKKKEPSKRAHQFASSDGVDKSSDESELTSIEKEMLEDVNHHLLDLQTWHAHASEEMIRDINEVAATTTLQEYFDAIAANFRAGLRKLASDFRHDHETLLKEKVIARRDLAIFKDENKIHRQGAEYPESQLLHFALIFLAVVGEGAANMGFFPQDLGLLGGFFTAVGVSLGNVAISVLIGVFFMRNLNHVNWARKTLGGIGIVIGVCLIATLHLAVAHYREAVARNPDEHLFSVLPKVWSNPLGLQDMESIVLIIIGVVVSIFAVYEGYTWDDRYPGFGRVYRAWKERSDAANEHMKLTKQKAMEVFDRAEQEILGVPNELRAQETKLLGIQSAITAYFSCFATYKDRAEQTAKSLVVNFRQTLQKVLEDPRRYPVVAETIPAALRSIDPQSEGAKVEALYRESLSTIQTSLTNYDTEKSVFLTELEKELYVRMNSVDEIPKKLKGKERDWLDLDSEEPLSEERA